MILTRSKFEATIYGSEDQFAAGFNMYVSHNYPELRGYYYHIKNESQADQHRTGTFSAGDRERLKQAAMGVMPGVLDYCFMICNDGSRSVWHVCMWYMELKHGKNVLSENQKMFIDRCNWYGIRTFIAWTPIQAADFMATMCGKPQYP